MSYYKICPNCEARLDPGEPCDCGGDEHAEEQKRPKGVETPEKGLAKFINARIAENEAKIK